MQILQAPEAKIMVEAYRQGYITLEELMEELEWSWERETHKGTRSVIAAGPGVQMPAILAKDM